MTRQNHDSSMTTPPGQDVEDSHKEGKESDGFLNAVLWAAVIAIIVRSFFFEPFSIPSGSMLPTLQIGDYLFVQKYKYGYSKYSFPLGILDFEGRFFESYPERGDIVVFRKPYQENIDYIKRVIGLPGDEVKMSDGRLYINEEIVPRDYLGLETMTENGIRRTYKKFVESLPDGPEHYTYEISKEEPLDFTPRFTIPDGYFFAMGDNRDASLDSRAISSVGFIPVENLVGRAAFFFFSIEPLGDACEKTGTFATMRSIGCMIVTIPANIRYERIFRPVHRDVEAKTDG